MLQKFFGYRVELVEHSPEYTLVKADTAVKVGTQIPVRVSGANGKRTPSVPMVVVSCRPCEQGGYLLAGKFLVDHPDLTGIEIPDRFDSSLRAAPRVCCHLCVISRDLPGYRVMTVDLSEGGLQVETPAEVKVGASVLLRLEFDTGKLPAIQASATVAWCSQLERGKFRIGLQFTSIDDRAKEVIVQYRGLLERREQADIQTRALGDEEIHFEQEVPNEADLPCLKVLEWQGIPLMPQATLVGYLRAGDRLSVRLRGGRTGVRKAEYQFVQMRGLRDNLESEMTARQIAEFRFANSSEGFYRFQFLDQHKQVLLEVEAAGCKETSPETN